MRLEWDEDDRTRVRLRCGLDLAAAGEVFEGLHFDLGSAAAGEPNRMATFGFLEDRPVVVTWERGAGRRRVVAMRPAHAEEPRRFEDAFRRMDRGR